MYKRSEMLLVKMLKLAPQLFWFCHALEGESVVTMSLSVRRLQLAVMIGATARVSSEKKTAAHCFC